jgi:hypothetical protein
MQLTAGFASVKNRKFWDKRIDSSGTVVDE